MRIEPKEPANLPTPPKSLGELFADLSAQISALVRQEVQLAKTEISEKVSGLAKGAAALRRGCLPGHRRVFRIVVGRRLRAGAGFARVGSGFDCRGRAADHRGHRGSCWHWNAEKGDAADARKNDGDAQGDTPMAEKPSEINELTDPDRDLSKESAGQLKGDIEATRDAMSATIDAIQDKIDPRRVATKARAEVSEKIREKVEPLGYAAQTKLNQAAAGVRGLSERVAQKVRDNPDDAPKWGAIALGAAGALALGIGALRKRK